ncbi:P-II family nitrogen regulator [Eubacteriales bacterium OttesenSCG-928-A19]|nr:P-II family nitrogen regulator [Eubacteriales bacterium OttesenSCG-928-A19]
MRALYVIVNTGFANEVVDVARTAGVKGATIMNARGAGAPHGTVMGITVDPQKEIIIAVVDEETAERAMAAVKEKAGVETPARSVCFTVPVDKTIGI